MARFAAFRQRSEQYTRGRLPGVWVMGVPQWQRGPLRVVDRPLACRASLFEGAFRTLVKATFPFGR
jgi:hypothetical protein